MKNLDGTRKLALCALFAVLLCRALPAAAQGMLLPVKTPDKPLDLVSHRVEAVVKEGAAKTTVTQVFHNNCASPLEATYVFPLPAGSSVSDFALWIGGEKKKGEVLEKDEASKIYHDIVAKLKDPGLLEYVGGKIFRAKIFPVPAGGDQKVELSFTQELAAYKELRKYVYPLRTSGQAAQTLKDFTFTAKIAAKDPIKSVYSPSHEIDVQWDGQKSATVGFEKYGALLDRDFVLFFNVTDDRVGLGLLPHRTGSKEGTFLLVISPGEETKESEVIDKNVTFVIDTSGSMNGEKMAGAKKALAYCIGRLAAGETFNVVRFSSTAQAFFDGPVAATEENKKEAVEKAGAMMAAGGTAIEKALALALKDGAAGGGRAHYVVFVTDGMPTVGETDPAKLVAAVGAANTGGSRIFVFGLGEDVNANFLDLLAQKNHAVARYAETGEKLEDVLERFYSAVAFPALTDVTLSIEGVKTSDLFPQAMPDLYYGEQLTVAGRYAKGGDAKVVLKGKIGGKEKKLGYGEKLPDEEKDNDFVEHIWATRKVGYLLDQIRLNGESQELKDEVIALARAYGIVTPYTSFLVVEDTVGPLPEPGPGPWPAPQPAPFPPGPFYSPPVFYGPEESASGGSASPGYAPGLKKAKEQASAMDSIAGSAGSLKSEKAMGQEGAVMSKVLDEMKNTETQGAGPSKMVGGKLFVYTGGRWVDGAYKKEMKLLKIEFGSDAYFALVELRPDLVKALALGTRVIVVVGEKKAISIESGSDEKPSKKDVEKFLK